MNISFKKLRVHHFLSMGDCEVDLSNRGYCLVSGINNNPSDAAKSNGSGKSTIWSALSYALTGKTTQGISSGLPNSFYNDGCWVSLSFESDGHSYEITRSKEDKALGTNLKISVDGQDRSGKGIRESEEMLGNLLPDLNEELIGSIIILGQGMPNKFTRNTPSKRKEILEHLSKSDFMIDDLKARIANRASTLATAMRGIEDEELRGNTLSSTYSQQLANSQNEIEALRKDSEGSNLDDSIKSLEEKLSSLNGSIKSLNESISTLNSNVDNANSKVLEETNKRQAALTKVREEHEEYSKEDNASKARLQGDIYILSQEIAKLKANTDICPTCGQRIPNVSKPDTSQKEAELAKLNGDLASLNQFIADDNEQYQEALKSIGNDYDGRIKALQDGLMEAKESLRKANVEMYAKNNEMMASSQSLATLKAKRDSLNSNLQRVESTIKDLQGKLSDLQRNLKELDAKGSNTKLHQDVVSKMSTYIKRDFRGFLLSNVIDYIQLRARDYCSKIFNTDDISFKLDGNNIDISFCGKPFELLSGGEQQRADLIIQFAIRDMMCQYLSFGCNILVLDEITDNLDSVSCDRVLNFISNELGDIESVFIISHHSSELGICNDGEIVVMKDANGVSEITSQY